MSLSEVFIFLDGFQERERQRLRELRFLMWSNIQPHINKEIKPESMLDISGEVKKAKRSGITAEEHRELERKFKKIMENDRASKKLEGVRIKHNSGCQPKEA